MEKKVSIYDYKIDEIVPVFHWGAPSQMIVIGHDEPTQQVHLRHMPPAGGSCYYSVTTLQRMAKDCAEYTTPISVPEWWKDNYTDGSGNCFSDADSGL